MDLWKLLEKLNLLPLPNLNKGHLSIYCCSGKVGKCKLLPISNISLSLRKQVNSSKMIHMIMNTGENKLYEHDDIDDSTLEKEGRWAST